MTQTMPKIAVLGGGTGTFMMLQALKRLPVDLTAILTMVDDGGSNRVLRDKFGLLPTSGITQCIVALSEDDTVLRELFNYRYHQGDDGLSGMRFGNLFMAALTDIMGSQKAAIEETERLLRVRGTILPISYDDVRLIATYEDGSELVGEHEIDEPPEGHDRTKRITHLRTEPEAHLNEEARQSILEADFIVIGPGDFYTNTVANFIVRGLPEALKKSTGKKIFVTNLMTKFGETHNYSMLTFLEEVERYYGLDGLDYVLVNNNTDYPVEALEKYRQEQAVPVKDDLPENEYHGVRILRGDLVSPEIFTKAQGDTLHRSILRHSPRKVASFFQEQFLT